jgi:uncharacterized protein YecT (DUF1311 family)
VACQKIELAVQDKRLNALYSSLKAASAKFGQAGELLVLGQRQWMAYRDGWCAFEAGHDAPPNPEVNGLICRIELTKTQADRLDEQLEELR